MGHAPAPEDGELDPGIWEPEPDPAEVEQLREKLEKEELPEFTRVRLL